MDFKRFGKHLITHDATLKRYFNEHCRAVISSAIVAAEREHRGEIRFVVEAALDPAQLLRGVTPRERALDIFSQLRVWDTELNSGVLIYVLFADRAVEIVADRGIHDKTARHHCWEKIVKSMEAAFAAGSFEAGAVDGINAVAAELKLYFPAGEQNPDELANDVVLL